MAFRTQPLYATRIKDRPKHGSWSAYLIWPLIFVSGMVSINSTQLLFLPLHLFPPTRPVYASILRYSKSAFIRLLILSHSLFAPTTLTLTSDGSIDLDEIVTRDAKGRVTGLDLPKRCVVMGNHQAYSDWMYAWVLGYFSDASDGIIILLKKSLKHIPVIGWGMQLYDFIFLARRWSEDQLPLAKHLQRLATSALQTQNALWIMIFPEGTLISDNERPKSLKWAKAQGIPDTTNILLPRSTGLYAILTHLTRSFASASVSQPARTDSSSSAHLPSSSTTSPTTSPPFNTSTATETSSTPLLLSSSITPSISLLDLTIGYPGTPPAAYAQDYYSLLTIFQRGVPPPSVHIHLRLYDPSSLPGIVVSPQGGEEGERGEGEEGEKERKEAFSGWLLERWREKDELMGRFYETGSFAANEDGEGKEKGKEVVVDVKLRKVKEAGDAVCWFFPWWVVGAVAVAVGGGMMGSKT